MHDDEYSKASKNNELDLHTKTLLKTNKNQNKLTNQLEPHRYKKQSSGFQREGAGCAKFVKNQLYGDRNLNFWWLAQYKYMQKQKQNIVLMLQTSFNSIWRFPGDQWLGFGIFTTKIPQAMPCGQKQKTAM